MKITDLASRVKQWCKCKKHFLEDNKRNTEDFQSNTWQKKNLKINLVLDLVFLLMSFLSTFSTK